MKRTAEDKKVPTVCCAIYTRKSTEEGLESLYFEVTDAEVEFVRPQLESGEVL